MIRRITDIFGSFYDYTGFETTCRCRKAPYRETPRSSPFRIAHPPYTGDDDCSVDMFDDDSKVPSFVPYHQRISPSYVYTPPQRLFSISHHTVDEKRLPTMYESDITTFGRPMMLLYFLAANADIMLPLASMRPVFGNLDTYIPQASARPTTRGFRGLYFNYLRTVIINRLRYAIDHLDGIPSTEFSSNIPELERGPVPILEYIVRDAMALFNPIDYIVTFLEQVVSHYRTLTTEDDRHAYRLRIFDRFGPLQSMYMVTLLYGQYMWDSRWASDDKLHRLVQLFEIVTTEVFPNAFEQIASKDNNVDETYRFRLKRFIFDIMISIAPCFLHHYRPMQRPGLLCVIHPWPSTYNYPIPVDQFPALMDTLRSDVVDCTREYLEQPECFSTPPPLVVTPPQTPAQNESSSDTTMVDTPMPSSSPSISTQPPGTLQATLTADETTTKQATTPQVQPNLFIQCDNASCCSGKDSDDTVSNSDHVKEQINERLNGMDRILAASEVDYDCYQLPFKVFSVSDDGIIYLIRSIVFCTPYYDPVYVALSPIFDHLTPEILNAMDCPMWPSPKFSCPYPHTHTLPDCSW